MNTPASKTCGMCKVSKSFKLFGNCSKSKDGKKSRCKECRSLEHLASREDRNKKAKQRYQKVKDSKELKAYRKKHYAQNKPAYLEKARKRQKLKKEEVAEYQRHYVDSNRVKINAYQLERYNRLYKSCPLFTSSIALRNLVRRSVESLKGNDPFGYFEEEVGYSHEDLKKRIECQMKPGMTWDNYGEWHIDHKIPISWFIKKGETRARIVNALCNLQPLWARDNLSKGNRWVG